MNKPQDFDTVQSYSERIPLPAGGYVCRIMQVVETASRSGAEMINISLDISEGEYANYFTNAYRNDTRQDKKWGCIAYQLTRDPVNQNTTNKGFKTFITAVCESNSGFVIPWGNNFGPGFKGKTVGVIFRRDEYLGADNKKHLYTKPFRFCSADTVRSGKFNIPEDKLLDSGQNGGYITPDNRPPLPADLSDFEEIVPDGELPF
ncbi:MAG: hypothetical protein NC120_03110 [Ruminococcus sp.]|nr:hypothetical protein [Ruminococcus sp.]